MAALHPTATQMLYRFSGDVSTKAAVDADLAAVTAGLPPDALTAAQSYLVVKEADRRRTRARTCRSWPPSASSD